MPHSTWRTRLGPDGEPLISPPTSNPPAKPLALPARYVDLGHLAEGGVGEVRRVQDQKLDVELVMKLHRRRASATQRLRFEREARLTARMHHPNIVPALDLGRLEDGTPWFTMPEVRGRTLREVVDRYLGEAPDQRELPLRRIIELLEGVARALAYAHTQHVVHRDVKPQNLMVGRFGDVRIMDFGVAMDLSDPIEELDDAVVGTPLYMAPEQARGETPSFGPSIDVYALGVMLYEVLTGSVPYEGDGIQIWHQIVEGPPPDPKDRVKDGFAPPEGMLQLVRECLSREPKSRPDATGVASRLQAWLDGEERRSRARALVSAAQPMADELAALRSRAARQRALAQAVLEPLPSHAPATDKEAGWLLEDEADRADLELRRVEARYLQQLRVALNHDPDSPEAHERLAAYHRRALETAESRHDEAEQAEHEELLIAHDRGEHAAFLVGRSAVTLHTDPEGAAVVAQRLVHRGRRWQVAETLPLGRTPLDAVELPHGNWRLVVRASGRAETIYPVRLKRGEHWDGIPPGGTEPHPILLPRDLGPEEVYVPAGWYRTGGDPEALDPLPDGRVWIWGFTIARFPVTIAEYKVFLDDLGEAATPWVPMLEPIHESPAYRFDGGWKRIGTPPSPKAPITLVTPLAASAYAHWRAERLGLGHRLPHELEWEKAARGLDQRAYPWGNGFDWSLGVLAQSHEGKPTVRDIGSNPMDRSVYGVHDLGGNTRDICGSAYGAAVRTPVPNDPAPHGDQLWLVRGGCFASPSGNARSANRFVLQSDKAVRLSSFRLTRLLDGLGLNARKRELLAGR